MSACDPWNPCHNCQQALSGMEPDGPCLNVQLGGMVGAAPWSKPKSLGGDGGEGKKSDNKGGSDVPSR